MSRVISAKVQVAYNVVNGNLSVCVDDIVGTWGAVQCIGNSLSIFISNWCQSFFLNTELKARVKDTGFPRFRDFSQKLI